MTDFQKLLQAIEARGRVVAGAATRRASVALGVRAGELGVTASADGGDVWLSAPGLRERAFGSLRHLPDPRLIGLAS